jgi:hypothetical protein
MTKYLLAYHGGSMPQTPEEGEKVMAAWGHWIGSLGAAMVDGGNPTSVAKTIASNGSVSEGGGSNPVTGYSIIQASSLDDAVAKAKSCPQLDSGGTIEVAELIDM